MTTTRTGAIARAVFMATLLVGFSTAVSHRALAQGKVPNAPPAENSAEPAPTSPPGKVPPASVPDETPPALEPPVAMPVEEPAAEPTAEPADEAVIETATEPAPEPVATADVAAEPDLMGRIAAAQSELEAGFEPGEGDAFRNMLAADPDPNQAMVLGQLLYMRRHFARSAWFFAEAARANPDNASALNNFGVLIDEAYAADPANHQASWVGVGVAAVARANALRPSDPAIESNFARGQYNLSQVDADAADLDAAAEALADALAAEDDNIIFLANRALVLDALGDADGAARALTRAHELNATHPSLRVAETQVSPATTAAYAGASRNYCAIDYQCAQRCPPSIIGQINRVTCEMEQAGAQMSCASGEPFALNFNCAEQIPEFGILIPGLNAGFSVASPWGSFAAVVDGQGNVQWRIEAGPNLGPINPYIRVDGGYQPSGGWSVSDTRAGVKVNLVNGNPVGQAAGEYGYQPIYVQAEGSAANQSADVSAGIYGNATILH